MLECLNLIDKLFAPHIFFSQWNSWHCSMNFLHFYGNAHNSNFWLTPFLWNLLNLLFYDVHTILKNSSFFPKIELEALKRCIFVLLKYDNLKLYFDLFEKFSFNTEIRKKYFREKNRKCSFLGAIKGTKIWKTKTLCQSFKSEWEILKIEQEMAKI